MQYMEDIKVRNCAYAYAFDDKVMDALEKGGSAVRDVLYVPDMSEPIRGEDCLAIKIIDTNSGRSKMIAWHLDHAQIWKKHQVNAVQFQVCASIRLFCEITASKYFKLKRYHYATNIPISGTAWNAYENMMKRLDIHWKEIPANSIKMEAASLNCQYESLYLMMNDCHTD